MRSTRILEKNIIETLKAGGTSSMFGHTLAEVAQNTHSSVAVVS